MFALGVQSRMFARRSLFRSLRFNSSTTQPKLTWVDYFQLKKQNNRLNTIAGVFTGIGGSFITLTYLGNIEIDVEKPIMGFDPLMVMGGAVMLGGLVGYLLGPFLGSYVFRLSNKAKLTEFELKNSQFLSRLKVKRPDPSKQSFSNPIPDYYGEKIYSLKDYKQWLRDCNAFKRKSKEFL